MRVFGFFEFLFGRRKAELPQARRPVPQKPRAKTDRLSDEEIEALPVNVKLKVIAQAMGIQPRRTPLVHRGNDPAKLVAREISREEADRLLLDDESILLDADPSATVIDKKTDATTTDTKQDIPTIGPSRVSRFDKVGNRKAKIDKTTEDTSSAADDILKEFMHRRHGKRV